MTLVVPGLTLAKGEALTERECLLQGWFSPRLGGFGTRLALAGPHAGPLALRLPTALPSGVGRYEGNFSKQTAIPILGHNPFWDVLQGHQGKG